MLGLYYYNNNCHKSFTNIALKQIEILNYKKIKDRFKKRWERKKQKKYRWFKKLFKKA